MKNAFKREELIEVMNHLEPKIKSALKNTHFQEREDLEQEIKLKIIESYKRISNLEAPNFEEFLLEYLKNKFEK